MNYRLSKALTYSIYVIFAIATFAGVMNSVSNSIKIESLPEDFTMSEKLIMIENYQHTAIITLSNKKRIDSLEQLVTVLEKRTDSLKRKIRVNELMDVYRSNQRKQIIINDTLNIE